MHKQIIKADVPEAGATFNLHTRIAHAGALVHAREGRD